MKTIDPSSGQEMNTTPLVNKNYANTGGNTSVIAPLQQAPRTVQIGARLTF